MSQEAKNNRIFLEQLGGNREGEEKIFSGWMRLQAKGRRIRDKQPEEARTRRRR